MFSLDISKVYDMSWRYAIIRKTKNWKIDGRMLCFIENFMKERTFRVAVGNTLSNEATIENKVVQGAVLSVTVFRLAMSEICDGIQERLAERLDDPPQPQTRGACENQIQKAMHQITTWADDTGFQVRQHRILGLIIDSMTWNEHILCAKAKAEKNEPKQMPKSHQMGSKSRKSHQNTPNDNHQHTQIRRGSIRLSITGNP
jgi:hypothetical protein